MAKPDSESISSGNRVIFINFPNSGFKSLSLSARPSGEPFTNSDLWWSDVCPDLSLNLFLNRDSLTHDVLFAQIAPLLAGLVS